MSGLTAQITLSSRIAVVGDNGAGKTTLLKLLLGELEPLAGTVSRHPLLRCAYVSQHHTEALAPHLHQTATQYLVERFCVSDLEARSRLGRFGLSGDAALVPMQSLSGGQKTRVSLTAITWAGPHLLVLDEPTNHLDTNALNALAAALREFQGGVVLVSHNRAFCAAFCRDLWVVEGGELKMMRGDDEDAPFAELFGAYTNEVMARIGSGGAGGDADDDGMARRLRAANRTAAKLDKGRKLGGMTRTAMM